MEQSDAAALKARTIQGFDAIAAAYDQHGPTYFTTFGRRLVEIVGPHPGARVLDVATGRGAVLFPAAATVGERGMVVGIDLAAGMVQATRAEVKRRGVQNAGVQVMDAEELAFPPASFDIVLCGFGLMFFPRLDRALDGFRRVLVPAGTLGVSTFATGLNLAITPVLEAYGGERRRPGAQELSTAEGLSAPLERAGFTGIRVQAETLDVVYPEAEVYWSWVTSLLTRIWMQTLPKDARERLKAEAMTHLEKIRQLDGIHERITALFAVAHAT
jgi:ubiquinone/menaquinone biosynthesis C-methylase UbiE